MVDLLARLHKGEITLDEAYEIYDDIMERFHRGEQIAWWVEELGLDEYEATARAHGAGFAELAKFRYEGWPKVCSRCGREIEYKEYGWLFGHDQDGNPVLRHITCPE